MARCIENLKPWKPGQSGNPGGRPKRDTAAEIAKAIFERDAEAIERAFATALKKGDAKVFTALANRAYGKVGQRVETDEGDTPIQRVLVSFVQAADSETPEKP